MESNRIETFTPTLLWSQTYEIVEIEIYLSNISNEKLEYENNIFHFECFSSNKKYLIEFELEREISEYNISSRTDKKKMKNGIFWQRKEEYIKII